MLERFHVEESRLLSLEQAFNEVCQEHGLDAATMRTMAGRQFYTIAMPEDEQIHDAESLADYKETFSLMIQ